MEKTKFFLIIVFFSSLFLISTSSQSTYAGLINETNASWNNDTLSGGTIGSNATSQFGNSFSESFSENDTTTTTTTTDGAATQTAETSYEEELAELEDPQTIIDIINADENLQDVVKVSFNLKDLTSEDIDAIAETTAEVVKSLTSSRDYEYSGGKTTLTLTFTYAGEKKVEGFLIYDTVPKAFADDADKITVTASGAVVTVVVKDPVYSFLYETLEETETRTIEYVVDGKVDKGILDEISVPIFLAKGFEGEEPLPSEEEVPEEGAAQEEGFSKTTIAIILVVIILIAVYLRRQKR